MHHQHRHPRIRPSSSAGLYRRSRLFVLTALTALSLASSAKAADLLFVVANAAALNASDLSISNRLVQLGFNVKAINAAASKTDDATNKTLVVISSTITSADAGAKFRDVAVPVIDWEQAIYDDMLWTLNGATDHNSITNQLSLNVVDTGPLAAGLSGTNQVVRTALPFNYGNPSTNAIVVARTTDGNNYPAIFAYEKGATLIDGTSTAAERRVALFFGDDAPAALTEPGLLLFDAAVSWATHNTNAPVIVTQPSSVTVTTGSGDSATFAVPIITGQAPISVQWQKDGVNIPGATSRTYTTSTVTSTNAGVFTAVVTNPIGVVTSTGATLTVRSSTVMVPGLLREVYLNVAGTLVSDLTNNVKFPNSPDFVGTVSSFEVQKDWADNYGQRVSGWLVPDQSGDYVFYMSADDQAQLFLSTDESPSNKRLIAAEPEWNNSREFVKGTNGDPGYGRFIAPGALNKPANISSNVVGTITLQAGKRYYVEALHKEGGGGDNMAVAWKLASSSVAITNGAPPISSANLVSIYTPYMPADYGTTVSGYQDDFSGTTLGTNWVFRGGATNTPYSVSSGMLHVKTPLPSTDPNHLLLDLPYNQTNQEVLARIRILNFGTGDPVRGGIAAAVGTNSQGINLHFRDNTQDNITGRQVKLLDDARAWGPGYDARPDPTSTNKWLNNTWYWVRLKQAPNTSTNGTTNDIFGKMWLADGTVPEPSNWQMVWDRYTPAAASPSVRAGLAGIALGSNAGTSVFDVDYILIKADGLPGITVSQPPQAGDDSLGTSKNQPVTVAASKLLANDVDLQGNTLVITSAGPGTAQGGAVSMGANGITYTPPLDFVGHDSFYYTISNGAGGTGLGVVYVFVASDSVPSSNLVGVQIQPNGQANVRFAGIPGRTYTVQTSQDLVTWTTLGTAAPGANGIMTISDPGASLFSIRFYRTLSQ